MSVLQRLMAHQCTLNAVNRLVAPLPLFASPVLSLRSGIVGGVSLSEVLHYARRTQCFSPPNEHTPTSPKHEITPSNLKWFRHTIFAKRKSRKSGSQSVAAETKSAFRFVVAHWRIYRTFRFCRGRVSGSLRRAVGGSLQTASGRSPEPHKRLLNSLFAFSTLEIPSKIENLMRNFTEKALDFQPFTFIENLHFVAPFCTATKFGCAYGLHQRLGASTTEPLMSFNRYLVALTFVEKSTII